MSPTPFSGPQGSHHVSFGSVFHASLGQGGNNKNNGNDRNGGTVGLRIAQAQQQGSRLSIWELSTKTVLFFMDVEMKMS